MRIPLLALVLMVVHCNDSFIYQPPHREFASPAQFGLKAKDLWPVMADGTRLHAWLISGSQPRKGVILFFHGNGDNISSHFVTIAWLADYGFDLICYDYRGYGRSEGDLNSEQNHSDSLEMINLARTVARDEGVKLILYGQSLGSAIAMRGVLDIPDRSDIGAVVIEGGFSSFRAAGTSVLRRNCFWPFYYAPYIFLTDTYAPRSDVSEISPIPLIVIHGARDAVISPDLGRRVFEQAGEPREWMLIPEAKHLVWLTDSATPYRETLVRYLKDALGDVR